MSGLKTRYLMVIILLLITGIYVSIYTYASPEPANVDISAIPLSVKEWKGQDVPMEKMVSEILETDSLIMREYRNNKNETVWLAVVYYGDSKVGFHLPEGCYSGQGSFIINRGLEEISVEGKKPFSVKANKIHLEGDKGNQIILYFYEAGSKMTPSYQKLRLYMILNQIRHHRSSGALVRFSTPITNEGVEKALAVLKRFAQDMVPLLPEYLL